MSFALSLDGFASEGVSTAGAVSTTGSDGVDVSAGVATPNAAYETATHEAAFVLHPEVCEALIPNPMSGSNGLSFDPVNYRGKFDWKNIVSEITNPDGTIGFFRGVLASATKPIKTEFGFVIVYLRGAAAGA